MKERIIFQPMTTASEDWPEHLSLSLLLFRFIWPFWLFRDASQGDHLARAAAYSHNRGMRGYLPGYLMKWLINTALALGMSRGFESLSSRSSDAPDVFLIMAASAGMLFAVCVCMLLVTGFVYLFLSRS